MVEPDDNDDLQLVARALRGSDAAWSALVDKYRIYAYRLAWRVTCNEDDSLDAAQETMIKLATRLADFRAIGSLRSWIATIAIREATTICRRRSAAPLAMDPADISQMAEMAGTAADTTRGPGEHIDISWQLERVQQAMSAVTPQQRAILLLAVENDMGPAEIARELNLPANQVRSQQSRAIARLREILKSETEESVRKVKSGS